MYPPFRLPRTLARTMARALFLHASPCYNRARHHSVPFVGPSSTPPPLPHLLALCGAESRERRRTARASRSGRTERRERFLKSWRSGHPAGRRDGAQRQSESTRKLAGGSAPRARQDSPRRSESLLGGGGRGAVLARPLLRLAAAGNEQSGSGLTRARKGEGSPWEAGPEPPAGPGPRASGHARGLGQELSSALGDPAPVPRRLPTLTLPLPPPFAPPSRHPRGNRDGGTRPAEGSECDPSAGSRRVPETGSPARQRSAVGRVAGAP